MALPVAGLGSVNMKMRFLPGLVAPPNVLSIGTVTTLPAGSAASAAITGATPAQVLNLSIPAAPAAATVTPLVDSGTGAVGVSLKFAREDHVHGTDTSRAPLASPSLTGTPTAPTPVTADNSTAIATTAYVKSQGYITSAGSPVQSVAGRTGAVTLAVADVSGAAPAASPSFTGIVTTGGHVASTGSPPTAAAGAGAGATPPAPVLTSATDTKGQVTFGTGTTPAAGAQVTVTFASAYATSPIVILTPINSATSALLPYVAATTTGFTVSMNAPAASQANTVYGFTYVAIQ